jgi:uncharacterized membrane protein (UPF0127 family)
MLFFPSSAHDGFKRRVGEGDNMAVLNRVIVQRNGAVLGDRIGEAAGVWGNFKGLMFQKSLPPGDGLVFRPARGIHTNFMRFPIDLVFFDADQRVTRVRPRMVPWRLDFTNAAGVIELPAGAAAAGDVRPDDQLIFEPSDRETKS